MRPFKPVRWPCYIWWKDELKPRRKYLLFGPRNQGSRTASNYGFLIVAKKGTPPWVIEQEKYESRYWVTHLWHAVWVWGYWLLSPLFTDDYADHPMYKKAADHLSRVECQSRAQEIRARMSKIQAGESYRYGMIDHLSRDYAHSIHNASNYPYIKAAGWSVDDVYTCIIKNL